MAQLNKDDYREPISEIDLGKEVIDFTKLSKPEEVVSPSKQEEVLIVRASKPEEAVLPVEEEVFVPESQSIRESLKVESSKVEEAPREVPAVNVGVFPHIEIKEQEEPVIKPEEESFAEEPVTVSMVEEVPVRETNPLAKKIEITETEEEIVPEPIVEAPKEEAVEEVVEAPKEEPIVIESYKEIRDAFWDKVNPSNTKRFEELGLEETEENRSFLNDLSVKITFLDDDLEDSIVSEEEAVLKIKEIKNLLNK